VSVLAEQQDIDLEVNAAKAARPTLKSATIRVRSFLSTA